MGRSRNMVCLRDDLREVLDGILPESDGCTGFRRLFVISCRILFSGIADLFELK